MLSKQSAIAANRFGLGARPADADVISGDPIAWLDAQLAAASVRQPQTPAGPPASAITLKQVRELRLARQLARRAQAASDEPAPAVDTEAIREYGRFIVRQYRQQVAKRHRQAIASDQPFVERLVHFWSNHFAISADKQPIGAIAVQHEDEAIRPYVTGNFQDMLLAVERHPAMLMYLDNHASVGPNSMAARAVRNRGRDLGLNENLAREILELHTLGVDGGYQQEDVAEFAKVLTGWSVGRIGERRDDGDPGEFHFRSRVHEPGDKRILGKRYPEGGIEEGEQVLANLALQSATARHIATKLARHFVADEPSAALVDRLAAAYLASSGELMPVYRVLIEAEESWHQPLAKYKTPQDFVISTYRALDYTPDNSERILGFLTQLGQRPLTPGSPAGWPDTAAHWNGGNALLKRIEWASAVGRFADDRVSPLQLADAVLGEIASSATRSSIARAESASQAFAMLFAAPEFQRR